MAKSNFRRGFVTEAEEYAKEYRVELELKPNQPLSPWKLADLLAVPLVPLSRLAPTAPTVVQHFQGLGRSKMSAFVLPYQDTERHILYNDSHHIHRQASSIAHELAHIILGHPLRPPLDGEGRRNSDPTLEREADRLGLTLLVPRPAALKIAMQGISYENASKIYGVSTSVIKMRVDSSGAKRHAMNRKAYRERRGWR